MPSPESPSVGSAAQSHRPWVARTADHVGAFWQRITEGIALQDLWSQFRSEAHESYGFYSREVDWESIERLRGWRKPLRIAWALFQAMLMKLSPARRVLLVLAVLLMLWPTVHVEVGQVHIVGGLTGLGGLVLFVLLALELADRVTMKRDLEIAREIQALLVPSSPPRIPGVDIAFSSRPANTVAGDYYDAFLCPAEGAGAPEREPAAAPASDDASRLLLVVADVAGKSVPAALLMATFQACLKALAALPGSLENLVRGLNGYACAHSLGGMRFTTAFLAELDRANGTLEYVNAGHNAPALCRAAGGLERLEEGGVPLGIEADARYTSGRTSIGRGDLLVVFTDGMVEAVNSTGEEYGERRLLARLPALAGSSADVALKALMADVEGYVGQARQQDDITCLVLRAG